MSSIKIAPARTHFETSFDSDGDLRVEVTGELHADPIARYDRVYIELAFLDEKGALLAREEAGIDLDFMVEGECRFNTRSYVKPPNSTRVKTVEYRLFARRLEVDKRYHIAIGSES